MRGLVLKDLLLMMKMNKKMIAVMNLLVIAIAFLGENDIYAVMSSVFCSLSIGMHFMMTMTYDGRNTWKQYELTLPVTKYQVIASKYLTCLVFAPISAAGTVIIYAARYAVYHSFSWEQLGGCVVTAVLLPVLWCSVCLAFAQWLGYTSVQYVRAVSTLLLIILINKMPENAAFAVKYFVQNPVLLILTVLAVSLAAYFASVIGYARKE